MHGFSKEKQGFWRPGCSGKMIPLAIWEPRITLLWEAKYMDFHRKRKDSGAQAALVK